MATEAELLTEKANIETELAKLTSNPKPTYKLGDMTFQWNEYYDRLMKRLDQVNQELSSLPSAEVTLYDDPKR